MRDTCEREATRLRDKYLIKDPLMAEMIDHLPFIFRIERDYDSSRYYGDPTDNRMPERYE